MTVKMKCARRLALPVTALAALVLVGCTSGHVGEDWQCPLATGGSCDSVAAADPAVPKANVVQAPASGQPIRLLPRDVETERLVPSMESPSCEASCGFDPLAWLARLFGTDAGGDDRRSAAASATTTDVEEASSPSAAAPDGDAGSPAAALPAGSASGDHGSQAGDLRTGEVVARIWIAPFVDAEGVYREGAYVRVVLEPAGWRLP